MTCFPDARPIGALWLALWGCSSSTLQPPKDDADTEVVIETDPGPRPDSDPVEETDTDSDVPVDTQPVPRVPEILVPFPPPTLAMRPDAACGLSPAGEVSCWGESRGPEAYYTREPPEGQWGLLMLPLQGLVLSPGNDLYAFWPPGVSQPASPTIDYIFPFVSDIVQVSDWLYGESCVLDRHGVIRCSYAVDDVPEGDGWTWVSVTYDHLCAIHEFDGLRCWGDPRTWGTLPEDYPRPRAVAASVWCTCIITEDYRVACDGYRGSVRQVPTLEKIVRLDNYTDSACAIDVDGHMTCWGTQIDAHPVPAELAAMRVHDVALAAESFCAVSASGELVCWGEDRRGVVSDAPSRLR